MLAIRGIYDGTQIKPLEEIPYEEERKVIITFLDKDVEFDLEPNVDPIKVLRGCATGEKLTEKLLKARREDLAFEARKSPTRGGTYCTCDKVCTCVPVSW
ncbi:MAG: hypothetical protein O7E52_26830 [Candidatus Poribacteria bacterium]|nr:hypothetical protein [Candidatus Poribacteria bacterium]